MKRCKCIDNSPPTVMHSQLDIHRSVANIITKTSTTEGISLTVRISVLLCINYQITYGFFSLCNKLKRLHSNKQY